MRSVVPRGSATVAKAAKEREGARSGSEEDGRAGCGNARDVYGGELLDGAGAEAPRRCGRETGAAGVHRKRERQLQRGERRIAGEFEEREGAESVERARPPPIILPFELEPAEVRDLDDADRGRDVRSSVDGGGFRPISL
jgi:hypothetical protein